MHSDLEQAQREEVMKEFKNGHIDILVATDVVARGIDINDIRLVVNFDIPHDPEDYVHRIGRTARGTNGEGLAITFVSPEEQAHFKQMIPRSARCPNMSPRNTVRVRRGGDARGDRRPSGSASGKRSFSALRSGSASRKRSFLRKIMFCDAGARLCGSFRTFAALM